jgi:hypothetical protein
LLVEGLAEPLVASMAWLKKPACFYILSLPAIQMHPLHLLHDFIYDSGAIERYDANRKKLPLISSPAQSPFPTLIYALC